VTRDLLKSGAAIQEMNTVRKHLSAIQGGRLAAASRASVLALIISDVTGDDPTHIASGPCAPDPTTYADALEILQRYRVTPPASVKARLERAADETPKPGNPIFARVTNKVIATAHRSLEAAAAHFAREGITPVILGDTITGEAAEVAKVMAALTREIQKYDSPFKRPVALISGGECTVTVRGEGGRGGRCAEFLLSLAIELGGIWAIAADTDGIDGSEDNAGAVHDPRFSGTRRAWHFRPSDFSRERQLRVLQRTRRSGRDRPNAHQRERLPRDHRRLIRGAEPAVLDRRRRARSYRLVIGERYYDEKDYAGNHIEVSGERLCCEAK
jgi:glycerate-2-kinase